MTSTKIADLKFGFGASSGFSAASIAAFDDLRPTAVVRELLQNSLDAARSAGVSKSSVQFRLNQVSLSKIPGIVAYKEAFSAAVDRQHDPKTNELSGQAKLIADRIEAALSKSHLEVLSIIDNGVGLDKRRMDALLSDGVSAKDNQATGTYGNGHFTAIPASDLRYILYGGVSKNGSRIGAGHAVLASHYISGEQYLRGADGFFIRDFNAGKKSLYDYVINQDLPELISQDLDYIQSTHGHGTSVIITAFNHFLEEGDLLWHMIARAASANFFIAIKNGCLEITVEDKRPNQDSVIRTLDHCTLRSILADHQAKKRSGEFISSSQAFEAYKTFCSGQHHKINTEIGTVAIHLLENPTGSTRIDLCRNGMWITDDRRVGGIPGFSYKFTDRIPFHAVLSLNSEDGQDLHELIRIAEGPLHDSIRLKRLQEVDRKRCRKALNEIREWILDHTKSFNSDPYTPDDFLTIDFGDEVGDGTGKSRKVLWGKPVTVNRQSPHNLARKSTDETEPGEHRREKKGNGKPSNPQRSKIRPSLPTIFQATSRPTGKHRRLIIIDCLRNYDDAEMRIIADEAIDATCDRPNQDPYTPAILSNVTVNGEPVLKQNLRKLNNQTVGVYLGKLLKGTTIEIETDYHLSGDFADLPDAALRIQLFKSSLENNPKSKSKISIEENSC